ncbi:NAD(P)H-dependent oxidoreductase [Elizabethkingia argentiflava]|uniref:NAD(P)H-dependent oxidoreductase n=1 Tax=Elizabethkingia argenteiflava TaxID=2681556 RepID=A0A845PVJ0_9FLAO|nr:nitroreductase family protein [Elizabethkingia argenteiflava]NAW50991.1 NAD(P)H-dependent oxidoreductase [Elizabethkingia argenteiflava]
MDFLDLMKNRYTTKKYNTDKKVSDKKILELKEILHLSASSINSQPWTFIFISDEKIKHQLAEVSYLNEQRVKESSHLVVFAAIDDVEYFEKRLQKNRPSAMGYYNEFLKPKGETHIKSWMKHQVYLSLGFFLSACASMGIDSTPMEGIQNEEYDSILSLSGYKTVFAVAIGYRDVEDVNQPNITSKSRLPLQNIITSLS